MKAEIANTMVCGQTNVSTSWTVDADTRHLSVTKGELKMIITQVEHSLSRRKEKKTLVFTLIPFIWQFAPQQELLPQQSEPHDWFGTNLTLDAQPGTAGIWTWTSCMVGDSTTTKLLRIDIKNTNNNNLWMADPVIFYIQTAHKSSGTLPTVYCFIWNCKYKYVQLSLLLLLRTCHEIIFEVISLY